MSKLFGSSTKAGEEWILFRSLGYIRYIVGCKEILRRTQELSIQNFAVKTLPGLERRNYLMIGVQLMEAQGQTTRRA
jgi:hypothetical protein